MTDEPLKSDESPDADDTSMHSQPMTDSDSAADSEPSDQTSPEQASPDESVEIEDDSLPEQAGPDAGDDEETSVHDSAARELEGDSAGAGEGSGEAEGTPSSSSARHTPEGDSDWSGSEDVAVPADAKGRRLSWVARVDPRDVMVELKAIETEVREALIDRDPRRKRKFAGTRRWLELEEDIISWRFSGRIDEETLTRIQRLITRRHMLFRQLRYLSGTRPVWNS